MKAKKELEERRCLEEEEEENWRKEGRLKTGRGRQKGWRKEEGGVKKERKEKGKGKKAKRMRRRLFLW